MKPNVIYLDTCCYNRPFDDLKQHRIQSEATAVENLLRQVACGEYLLVSSRALVSELIKTTDTVRRVATLRFLALAARSQLSSRQVRETAASLISKGFARLDAEHLASAKHSGVDSFLTVDDAMLRRAKLHLRDWPMRFLNPVEFQAKLK